MMFFRTQFFISLLALFSISAFPQSDQKQAENSLLWQISGNGITRPSYLYGTIHMLCAEDAVLSDSLKAAIRNTELTYLEVDMDNLFEILGAMSQMKMRNDTTLADLLRQEDYKKVKDFIESKNSLLPFSILETMKPLLASSTLMESGLPCGAAVAMEQLIMQEAISQNKKIEGLETMTYQLSLFDSIPYKLQAEQLLKFIDSNGNSSRADREFMEMLTAYKEQNLNNLAALIKNSEDQLASYEDLLLNNRNRNWVEKLKNLIKDRPVTIAVGAGHLPGNKGLINLLRQEGFTVTPVKNKISSGRII